MEVGFRGNMGEGKKRKSRHCGERLVVSLGDLSAVFFTT